MFQGKNIDEAVGGLMVNNNSEEFRKAAKNISRAQRKKGNFARTGIGINKQKQDPNEKKNISVYI